MNNYLVPMWSYKNKEMKNHLALIKSNNKYPTSNIASIMSGTRGL